MDMEDATISDSEAEHAGVEAMAMPGGAAVAGAMYGYPKCCRESFVTHSAKTEDGKALRALGGRARRAYQRRMDLPMWGPDWPYSPEIEYVPCAQCSTRIESGGEPLPLEYERTRGEVVFSVDDVAQMAHAAQALESDEFAAVRAWLLAGRGDARNVAARQKLRERARVHPHDMSMHSCNNCGATILPPATYFHCLEHEDCDHCSACVDVLSQQHEESPPRKSARTDHGSEQLALRSADKQHWWCAETVDEFTLFRAHRAIPTYARLIRAAFTSFRSRPCFGACGPDDSVWSRVSYATMYRRCIAFLTALRTLHPTATAVGFAGPNCTAHFVVDLACAMAGVVAVPIQSDACASTIAHIIRTVSVSCVIVHPDLVGAFRTALADRAPVYAFGDLHDAAAYDAADVASPADHAQLLARGDADAGSKLVSVIHTSGSTGRPKGVRFTDAVTRATLFEGCSEDSSEDGFPAPGGYQPYVFGCKDRCVLLVA